MGYSEGFIWGALGGLIPEFYALYQIRKNFVAENYGYLSTWVYWTLTIVMISIGGGLVDLYIKNGIALNSWAAINIGASAPFILGNVTKHSPKSD